MQFDTLQLKIWKKKVTCWKPLFKDVPRKGGQGENQLRLMKWAFWCLQKKENTCIHYLIFSGKILPTFRFHYCVIFDCTQPDIGTFLVSRNCALWGDGGSKKLMNFFHNTCYLHTPVKMHRFQSIFSFRSYWISSAYLYVLILIKMNYLELRNASRKKKKLKWFLVFSNRKFLRMSFCNTFSVTKAVLSFSNGCTILQMSGRERQSQLKFSDSWDSIYHYFYICEDTVMNLSLQNQTCLQRILLANLYI